MSDEIELTACSDVTIFHADGRFEIRPAYDVHELREIVAGPGRGNAAEAKRRKEQSMRGSHRGGRARAERLRR